MKKALILGGLALAAYGLYAAYKSKPDNKKKSGCGCAAGSSGSGGKAVELYPDAALEHFDTSFRSIFPTPTGRLGQGPLPLQNTDAVTAENVL